MKLASLLSKGKSESLKNEKKQQVHAAKIPIAWQIFPNNLATLSSTCLPHNAVERGDPVAQSVKAMQGQQVGWPGLITDRQPPQADSLCTGAFSSGACQFHFHPKPGSAAQDGQRQKQSASERNPAGLRRGYKGSQLGTVVLFGSGLGSVLPQKSIRTFSKLQQHSLTGKKKKVNGRKHTQALAHAHSQTDPFVFCDPLSHADIYADIKLITYFTQSRARFGLVNSSKSGQTAEKLFLEILREKSPEADGHARVPALPPLHPGTRPAQSKKEPRTSALLPVTRRDPGQPGGGGAGARSRREDGTESVKFQAGTATARSAQEGEGPAGLGLPLPGRGAGSEKPPHGRARRPLPAPGSLPPSLRCALPEAALLAASPCPSRARSPPPPRGPGALRRPAAPRR